MKISIFGLVSRMKNVGTLRTIERLTWESIEPMTFRLGN